MTEIAELIMPNLNLNTRVAYDKFYAWDSLCNKHFQRSLAEEDPDRVVELTVQQLRQMSDESHEYGRIRERALKLKTF